MSALLRLLGVIIEEDRKEYGTFCAYNRDLYPDTQWQTFRHSALCLRSPISQPSPPPPLRGMNLSSPLCYTTWQGSFYYRNRLRLAACYSYLSSGLPYNLYASL